MKCVLSDEELKRSTSSEADDLLVGYHLFQTAIFFGTNSHPNAFGDVTAAESGDFSKSLFVVPGVDFAMAWSSVFPWLESSEKKWVYQHPDDAARLVLVKADGERVRIYLDWAPTKFVEAGETELGEVSLEVVDELVIKLVDHLPKCPAKDVAESLEGLDEAYSELE
ncbi:hypothetical protein HRD49_08990 [Corallococcus exiguus]|uniref:hypothetical protein n=1 Tax=Corallococcus exiguus TaxID=83462 RepID=UPI0014732482|nr:hypothetical protein [Corallococcus exiguus]NNB93221.1 hypothetical protein [Corallococcus exiguus]NRD61892.1 hypothetical protein [Corallococcus exiguus]